MSTNNIFHKPIYIKRFGNVYPIQVGDWEKFESCLNVLMISKKHIEVTVDEDIALLHRIVLGLQDDEINKALCKLFNLISKTDSFKLDSDHYHFINDESQRVDFENYDEIRNTIFNQNILFEPKVYKDPLMQQWANKVLEARSKNAANITMEDMVTTVAVISGKHYWDLEKYSIYQLKSEFQRINKIKAYDTTSIMFANPYATDIKLDHFAEYLDMYADPYQDLFKSKDKLKNIDKALG